MKEVFASLYNDRAISYRVHKGFAHADVALSAGRAAHGALRPGRRRRDVHHRHRIGLQGRGLHHQPATAWARRWCRARSTPTSSTCTSRRWRPGKFPVIRRVLGSKLQRMEFASAKRRPPAAAGQGRGHPPEQRNRYSLSDADVIELARFALIIEKHYGRPMDIEWGKDGATASSTSCRPGPRP
jgi:pyruvate,water dikinase